MDRIADLGNYEISQPIPSVAPEKFIPVDAEDIVERVVDSLFAPKRRQLAAEVIRLIINLRRMSTAKEVLELSRAYDEFNPDNETVNLVEYTAAYKKTRLEEFKAKVLDLVISANYLEIDRHALENILKD